MVLGFLITPLLPLQPTPSLFMPFSAVVLKSLLSKAPGNIQEKSSFK
jgi:hypothetical protein